MNHARALVLVAGLVVLAPVHGAVTGRDELLARAAQAHAALLARPGEERLCAWVHQLEALVTASQQALAQDSPWTLPDPAPPGVGVSSTIPDGTPLWVVDHALVAQAAPRLAGAKLHAAAAPLLWPGDAAVPPFWLARDSALTACWDVQALPQRLDAVRTAYAKAPRCTREQLDAPLSRVVGGMAQARCFCAGSQDAVKRTLAALRQLPWPEGRAAAQAWEKDVASGALRWGCVEDTADFTR